ncbi:MAG: twin-arginine translocation signal domain-containing protein [Anaerolineales bacterium]
MTDSHKPNDVNKMSRRDFVKTGLASAVALVLGGLTRKDALAANSFYFGTDSDTASCTYPCGMPQDFYIGKTGVGTLIDSTYFNKTAALQCPTVYSVHTYWWLCGSTSIYRPAGYKTNYAWGKAQGKAACDAWYNSPVSNYFYGKTIFANVEDKSGWLEDGSAASKLVNRAVLQGFLDAVATYVSSGVNPGFVPGIYTRANIWQPYFGTTGYRTPRPAVLWLTGCGCSPLVTCAPSDITCTGTLAQAKNVMENRMGKTVLGGNMAVIWQYYFTGDPKSCYKDSGDYDISINQSGSHTFNPNTSTSNWNWKNC